MLLGKLNPEAPSYFGSGFDSVESSTKDSWLMDMAELKSWDFDLDGRVANDTKFAPTGNEVRLFPLITGHKAKACHGIAIKAWKQAYQDGVARNWAHQREFKPYVNKLVYCVQVQTVNGPVWSEPFPDNYGLLDETPEAERTQDVPRAPQDVQDMYDLLMKGIAANLGFHSVSLWLETEGHTVYHFTINVLGTHTTWHHDEIVSDAPGTSIFNTSLAHSGMFVVESSKPEDKDEPLRGTWHMPGDCIAFKDFVRLHCQHAVYREYPVDDIALPSTPSILTPETVEATARVVTTIRVGKAPHNYLVEWWKLYAKAFKMKIPAAYRRYKTVQQQLYPPENSSSSSSSSSNSSSSSDATHAPTTRATKRRTATIVKEAQVEAQPVMQDEAPHNVADETSAEKQPAKTRQTAIKQEGYGGIPKAGAKLPKGRMWEGATARGTKGVNFLVMDRLKKNGPDQQEFKHNMTFLMQSKLTGSMQVEEFWVREVGRVYGKDRINRTMYRCVVLQRRVQGERPGTTLSRSTPQTCRSASATCWARIRLPVQ